MPTLKQLLEELKELDVEANEIKLPAVLYDDLLEQGEEVAEEEDK